MTHKKKGDANMKVINETTKYNLVGLMTITFWGGGTGWKRIDITTGTKGLEAIKKNPLQDYIHFGVENVDYVQFEVYKTVIKKYADRTETIKYNEALETIEAGKYNLSEETEETLADDFDYAEVSYV